jgi:hypothetical protein
MSLTVSFIDPKLSVVLGIIILFVIADKLLTVANISQVRNNFPDVEDPIKVEKNPVARWLFKQSGLFLGSVILGIITIITTFLGYLLMKRSWGEGVALYIIFMLYAFIIFNNLYFFLKYSRVII